MTVQPPCYDRLNKKDCPERCENCHADCERWANYVKERDKEYIRRQARNASTYGHDKCVTDKLKRSQIMSSWGGFRHKGND